MILLMYLNERWRRTSIANKLLVVVGAAAALFTFGQLLVLVWQLHILKRSGEVSSKQTDSLIAAETTIGKSIGVAIQDNRDAIKISAAENKAAIKANEKADQSAIQAANAQNEAIVRSSNAQSLAALRETQHLRDEAIRQRIESVRPVIAFEVSGPYKLSIRNFGRGPALNIELRLSQVRADGKLTYLTNLIQADAERNFFTLNENGETEVGGSENIRRYAFATDPMMQWGEHAGFAAIATYTDLNRRPYYSVSLVHTIPNGAERSLVMKSTKTDSYESGNIEQLDLIDLIK